MSLLMRPHTTTAEPTETLRNNHWVNQLIKTAERRGRTPDEWYALLVANWHRSVKDINSAPPTE